MSRDVTIIPVLDLMNGRVVQAVGGLRDQYRPVQSVLSAATDPVEFANDVAAKTGCGQFYLADLDAITQGRPQWSVLRRLAELPLAWWIDLGLQTAAAAKELCEVWQSVGRLSNLTIIAALETLRSPAELEFVGEIAPSERWAFSLDLRDGRAVSSAAWPSDPFALAQLVVRSRVPRLIVLDVHAVGRGAGVTTLPLCEQLREKFPNLVLVTGGGIRHANDIQACARAGAHGVLIASALHTGLIKLPLEKEG